MSSTTRPAELAEKLARTVETLQKLHGASQPLAGSQSGLRFSEVGYGYRPGRSLGVSLLFHVLALPLLLSAHHAASHRAITIRPRFQESHSLSGFMPTLGGGREGNGAPGGGTGRGHRLSSGVQSRSSRGFTYRGPQSLVSNPKRANLGIQTILQPPLDKLPRLRSFVPLPNIVRPPAIDQKITALIVKSRDRRRKTVVQAPDIKYPLHRDHKLAGLLRTQPQLPQRAAPEISELSAAHSNQKGLLVLNAVPPSPDFSAEIPHGELRSRFAISPAEVALIAEPSAGAKEGTSTEAVSGSGKLTDIARGDALAQIAGGGVGPAESGRASGTGKGGRYGNGVGAGMNSDNGGRGSGRGTASGSGLGTVAGESVGSGIGTGSAPGVGGFPGITIQGGQYGNGSSANAQSMLAARSSGSYNMTVVSTSNSGGGLPDLGVFQNEKVYTVYLDMRENDTDPAPSWTLQYAVLQPAPAEPEQTVRRISGTPTPPYATLKFVPGFTPELLRRCGRHLIIASAVMDTAGKLEQVSVKQTPDTEMIAPLVEALGQWVFQPAQIDGQPVALKVLLGIRLFIPR